MLLKIVAIGQMRGTAEADLFETYRSRAAAAGRAIGLNGPELVELRDRGKSAGDAKQAQENDLLTRAKEQQQGIAIMLDERGKSLTSRAFADRLGGWRDDGVAQATFFLGGADGLTPDLRAQGDLTLSLGAMTWPHMLARVMLTEQIWRAVSILSNHPYHRD